MEDRDEFSLAHYFHGRNKKSEVQSLSSEKHGADLRQEWETIGSTPMVVQTHYNKGFN